MIPRSAIPGLTDTGHPVFALDQDGSGNHLAGVWLLKEATPFGPIVTEITPEAPSVGTSFTSMTKPRESLNSNATSFKPSPTSLPDFGSSRRQSCQRALGSQPSRCRPSLVRSGLCDLLLAAIRNFFHGGRTIRTKDPPLTLPPRLTFEPCEKDSVTDQRKLAGQPFKLAGG
jgi:hypothetical protein